VRCINTSDCWQCLVNKERVANEAGDSARGRIGKTNNVPNVGNRGMIQQWDEIVSIPVGGMHKEKRRNGVLTVKSGRNY